MGEAFKVPTGPTALWSSVSPKQVNTAGTSNISKGPGEWGPTHLRQEKAQNGKAMAEKNSLIGGVHNISLLCDRVGWADVTGQRWFLR